MQILNVQQTLLNVCLSTNPLSFKWKVEIPKMWLLNNNKQMSVSIDEQQSEDEMQAIGNLTMDTFY